MLGRTPPTPNAATEAALRAAERGETTRYANLKAILDGDRDD